MQLRRGAPQLYEKKGMAIAMPFFFCHLGHEPQKRVAVRIAATLFWGFKTNGDSYNSDRSIMVGQSTTNYI